MLYINNSNAPYSEQRVSLGGVLYTFSLKFNVRNKAWYLSIFDSSGNNPLIKGIKIMPNQNLTGRYINSGIVGNVWCVRVKSDDSPINVNNLGSDGVYRLVWLSDRESAVYEVIFNGVT